MLPYKVFIILFHKYMRKEVNTQYDNSDFLKGSGTNEGEVKVTHVNFSCMRHAAYVQDMPN